MKEHVAKAAGTRPAATDRRRGARRVPHCSRALSFIGPTGSEERRTWASPSCSNRGRFVRQLREGDPREREAVRPVVRRDADAPDRAADRMVIRCALLCRWLRATRVRQGRRSHPGRRRPGEPDLARPALPEGQRDQEHARGPAAGIRGQYRRPYGTPLGGAAARRGDGHDRRPDRPARGDMAGDPPDGKPASARWGSPISAGRPSTTKRTT